MSNYTTRWTVVLLFVFATWIVPLWGGWNTARLHIGVPILSLDWTIPGWIMWLVVVPAAFVWLRRRRRALLGAVDAIGRDIDKLGPRRGAVAISFCDDCGLPRRACVCCAHQEIEQQ